MYAIAGVGLMNKAIEENIAYTEFDRIKEFVANHGPKDCHLFPVLNTVHWIALTTNFLFDDSNVYSVKNWPLAYYILSMQQGKDHPDSISLEYPFVITCLPMMNPELGKSDYMISPTLPQMLDMDIQKLESLENFSVTRGHRQG